MNNFTETPYSPENWTENHSKAVQGCEKGWRSRRSVQVRHWSLLIPVRTTRSRLPTRFVSARNLMSRYWAITTLGNRAISRATFALCIQHGATKIHIFW